MTEVSGGVSPNPKPARKVFCPICGKQPEDKAVCPNCGLENICGYHVYRFFSDQENSPRGCPKCGPRCSVCGAQTTLVRHGNRAVCSSCQALLKSGDSYRKEMQRETADKIIRILTTIFTLTGLTIGILMGMEHHNQLAFIKLVKFKMPKAVIIFAWGLGGFIAGSFLSAIASSFLRHD